MINYLYHLLHLILKMPALCLDACSQTTSPLLHCAFNNSVIKCRPLLHKSLSQMRNITYACLVHPSCITLQILQSTGLRSGLLGGHCSGEMKSGVSLFSSSTVSLALCAGALSCWKMKKSFADSSLMAGSRCSDSSTS